MKYVSASLVLPALLCGALLAQDSATAPSTPQSSQEQSQPQPAAPARVSQPNSAVAPAGNSVKIAPGSVIPVALAKTVDAKKAKTGDEVVATVIQDMKTNGGDVLVPKDTKIVGHVTEAQARSKEQKESQVGIAFDHAVIKGDQMALPMSIQAVIAQQTNNQAASGGSDVAPSAPSGSSPSSPTSGGRSGSMGGGSNQPSQPSPQQSYPQGSGGSDNPPQTAARPPITGNTQGVIGMPDVKLETAQNATQGSVLTSEKNNVKIEKGTFMLLRVNQAQ